MAVYDNLPGIFLDILDGNLTVYPDPGAPKFLILGTSPKEPADQKYPYVVQNIEQVKSDFGEGGTLYKTLTEASRGGAKNFVLWRLGNSDDNTGDGPGKRKLYEALFEAYHYMYDQPLDAVIPAGVYLDDANVMDGTSAASDGVNPAADLDTLGLFNATDDGAGGWTYTWMFPDDVVTPSHTAADFDGTVGALTASDFHEVNFAYQLAEFCYRGSQVVDMRLGFIGVNPATTWGDAASEAAWVGKLGTYDSDNIITADATTPGLIGNKFLSGRLGHADGPPAFKNAAIYGGNGGFYASTEDTATARCYLDDAELLDSNGEMRDIGKYLCIVGSWINFAYGNTTYSCSAAAAYGGFVQGGALPESSAPTNKKFRTGTLLGTVSSLKTDALAGKRITGLLNKATGTVIADAPTAANPASDYQRVSTMRQVEACVDGIREVGEPFLGQGMTGAQIAALDTAIRGRLSALVKNGIISKYTHQVVVTPQMKILGQAIVQLKVVPAFELRQITVVVGLSAT